MKRLFVILAVALSLAGCAGTPFGDALRFATSTHTNPVSPVNIYQAKVVYAATAELVVGYREFCWSKPYAVLMKDAVAGPLCKSRRSIVRTMQAADNKAFAAIKTADDFVRQNPTLNATGVISAALAAVSNFQSLASGYAATAMAGK